MPRQDANSLKATPKQLAKLKRQNLTLWLQHPGITAEAALGELTPETMNYVAANPAMDLWSVEDPQNWSAIVNTIKAFKAEAARAEATLRLTTNAGQLAYFCASLSLWSDLYERLVLARDGALAKSALYYITGDDSRVATLELVWAAALAFLLKGEVATFSRIAPAADGWCTTVDLLDDMRRLAEATKQNLAGGRDCLALWSEETAQSFALHIISPADQCAYQEALTAACETIIAWEQGKEGPAWLAGVTAEEIRARYLLRQQAALFTKIQKVARQLSKTMLSPAAQQALWAKAGAVLGPQDGLP